MPGDFSRKTFDPKKRYSGVLMQQGRVQLDADWNELVEILDRRWRAATTDIIGRCVVPKETPDGFKIEAAGGTFTIGRGRIYVDGLLAENYGKQPIEFDRVLAEERGTSSLNYTEQPYYHNPPTFPSGGPHLVYVDVWQREVSYLEDPELIEQAVGVDTTTRLQTVWQVKVLPNVGSTVTCTTPDDQIPGWSDLIRPSAGRLSTGTVPVSSDKDPCFLPPTGGYRGLENQLYRVEIHDGGAAGTATFKWSRDNATVATAVTAINGTRLTVDRTEWDSVRRFNPGDWVEITDDWLEFAGRPGEIRRIQTVDDAVDDTTRTINLMSTLPAGIFPTTSSDNLTNPQRHTRIRSWDQKGQVKEQDKDEKVIKTTELDASGSTGIIPVPTDGNFIILEDGVKITFHTDPAGGSYRVGDYWVFYARTATGSNEPFVEELQKAPPQGIHHHYGRLAIVTFPDTETDCRTHWPPEAAEGCCTVTVGDGIHSQGQYRDLASAITAIEAESTLPVRICLLPGIHQVSEPISIKQKNITIAGCGKHSQIKTKNTVFSISGDGVTLENFMLEAGTENPAIVWTGSDGKIKALDLDNTGPGIMTRGVKEFTAIENMIAACPAMSLQGQGLRILCNQIGRGGLELRGGSVGIRVAENLIANGDGNGITLGVVRGEEPSVLMEIDLERNHITGMEGSGIASVLTNEQTDKQGMVLGLRIAGNVIEHCIGEKAGPRPDGLPHGGIALASVRQLLVQHNRIQRNGAKSQMPVCGIFTARAGEVEITDNHVVNNGRPPDKIQDRKNQGGIVVKGSFGARITNNLVDTPGTIALYLKGMGPMKVTDNRLVSQNNPGLSKDELRHLSTLLQDFAHQPDVDVDVYVGTVLILNYGLPSYAASLVAGRGFATNRTSVKYSSSTVGSSRQAVVGGTVQFSDNQVMLGMRSDQEDFQLLGVCVLTLDDLVMAANQTESRLGQSTQFFNTIDLGMTARVTANGYTENPRQCAFSLVSLGALMSTGTDNQGTHCIIITGDPARTAARDNLSLACSFGNIPVFGKSSIGG